MRGVLVLVILAGLVFVSGCVEQSEGLGVSLSDISVDKEVYHSAEVMNLSMVVYSDFDLKNVSVKIEGINGRLNQEKVLNLSKGMNEVSFSYQLPKCNVCGGIKEGNYTLNCKVIYENVVVKGSRIISIMQ